MTTAWHIAAVCLVLAGLVWACRLVCRRSRLAGVMFAAGLVIRASGALFFFLISYFQLPLMTPLQMGNGFWMLAPDAQEYYRLSSQVAEHWHFGRLYTITPGYVGPLALWMRAVGVHPASPALFSLVLYAVSVVALVAAFGRARTRESQQAVAVGVAALSFSPMLIYFNKEWNAADGGYLSIVRSSDMSDVADDISHRLGQHHVATRRYDAPVSLRQRRKQAIRTRNAEPVGPPAETMTKTVHGRYFGERPAKKRWRGEDSSYPCPAHGFEAVDLGAKHLGARLYGCRMLPILGD